MPPYRLTLSAQKDLEDIARYTSEKWGKRQALHYGDLLEKHFQEIADKTDLSRQFSSRFPQVFVSRCEHHYIFFIRPENEPPCIIAVLHERMNFVSWLDKRL